MTTALDDLVAKVEAGTFDRWTVKGTPLTAPQKTFVTHAYNGSLDAALALHNAVLPGFTWLVGEGKPRAVVRGPERDFLGASDNPARSWLLAILRAMREGKQ